MQAPRVASKTLRMSESVIRMMTRLADEQGALNLAQGFPDFPAPSSVKEAAVRAIRQDLNQYAMTWGSPRLRRAVAKKTARFSGLHCDPEKNVTVTCGSTEAMVAAVIALAEEGDEVVVLEPFYENYLPSVILAGATPKVVPLGENFKLDEEALKSAFSRKTRLIIVNTPHNPSGKVLTRDELKVVADLCSDYGATAVMDEIYEHILYDGREHVSMAGLGDMADRTVTISGISKTYTTTGWRVGYAIAEESITDAIRKVHDYLTVCAPAPLQEAAAFALELPDSYYRSLASSYEKKRDLMTKGLHELGFDFFTPEGAYYILADFRSLSRLDDTRFAISMTKDCGVAVVPGSSFYADREKGKSEVRFSYSKKNGTLRKALEMMERYFRDN